MSLKDIMDSAVDLQCYGVIDAELQTAITLTTVELTHVQALLRLRGGKDQRLITDELEVLARLADLQLQASTNV